MQTSVLMLISLAVSVGSAWAQLPPISFQPLPQLQQFLQLTDSQLQTILTNNDAYNQLSWDKQHRILQVQSEIAEETGKPALNPNALGIRYAEIETICREMRDKANEYRSRNFDVLSLDQKPKLKVLEDALKLAPVISEAQYGNLIGGLPYAPYGFSGNSGGYGSAVGVTFSSQNGCSLPSPLFMIPANRISGATPMVNRTAGRWFDTTRFAKIPERGSQK